MITKAIIFVGLSVLIYWMAPKTRIDPRKITSNDRALILPGEIKRINWKNAVRKFENKLIGAESFTHDLETGVIYTGTSDGMIWKINKELTNTEPVIRIGLSHLDGEKKGKEEKFGRVLGLKFLKPNKLIAVCAYQGIFIIDLKKMSKELLVGPDAPTKLMGLFNSVDITKNGILYFTICSMKYSLDYWINGIIDNDNSGAVFSYNLQTKELHGVVKNISFPNGISLADDENSLIVSEMAKRRLIKIRLNEVNRKSTVFLDSLPGIPDNIKRDAFGNFYIAAFDMKTVTYFQNHPTILSALVWCIPHWVIFKLAYPNSYVYKINSQGKIIAILDDPRPGTELITEAYEIDNKIIVGSFLSSHLEVIYLK